MIHFILDTDTLTLFQKGHQEICNRFFQQARDNVAITVLSVEEQISGWYTQLRQAKKPERLAWAYKHLTENIRFLAQMQILTYDEKTESCCLLCNSYKHTKRGRLFRPRRQGYISRIQFVRFLGGSNSFITFTQVKGRFAIVKPVLAGSLLVSDGLSA